MKDLSDLHIAAVESGEPEMFKTTVDSIVWRAKLRQKDKQRHIHNIHTHRDMDVVDVSKWGAVRLVDLGEPEPLEYLVRNVVQGAQPTYIYGGRGSLKSITALALAIGIASPEVDEILGFAVEGNGPTIVFDSELNEGVFNARAKAICRGLEILQPLDLIYRNVVGVPPKESFPALHEMAEEVGAVAVVIDSFGFATRGNPEDYADMRNNTTEYLDPLIAKGIAPIVVEHKPHQGNHIFGSVAKEYHGRFIFRIEDLDGDDRVKGERNIRLINEKASFTEEGQKINLLTRFSDNKIVIENLGVAEEDAGSSADVEVKVQRALEKRNMTKEEIAQDQGVSEKYLGNVLPSMARRNIIYRAGTTTPYVYGLGQSDNPHGKDIHNIHTYRAVDVVDPSDPLPAPHLIRDVEGLIEVIKEVDQAEVVAIDVETGPEEVGLDPLRCTPGALALTTDKVYTAVVQLTKVHPQPLLDALEHKTLLGHNLKFDLRVLMHAYGYEHKGSTRDTLHLKYLVHCASGERKPENGKLMVPAWLPKRKIEGEKKAISEGTLRLLALDYLDEEVDKGQQTSDWLAEELDAEQVTYAAKDTSILFRLWDRLMEEYLSIADKALAKIGHADIDPEMVIRLDGDDLPAKTWMEGNGFAINAEKWQALAHEYKAIRIAAEEELFSLAGKGPDELNLGSDVQVIEVLESLGADLSKVPKTKKTQRPSLAADNIKKAKGPQKVQRFIELHHQRENAAKKETTYGEKWLMSPEEIAADPRFKKDQVPKHQYVVNGRVRSDFRTVRTGRDGSSSPNLQNLPSASKTGHRAALEVPEGRCLLIADYKQIELVVLSIVAGDTEMYEALKDPNRDLHSEMVYELWGDEAEGWSKEQFDQARKKVKDVNFGRAFLRGAKAIAARYEMKQKEAQALINNYDQRWTGVNAYHQAAKKKARKAEHTVTLAGRIRKISLSKFPGADEHTVYVPEWVNFEVQGTAGEGLKRARTMLYHTKDSVPGNPLLVDSVHDELVVECDRSSADEIARWLEAHMVNSMKEMLKDPNAPVRVEIKPPATNYAAVKEVDDEP